MRRNKTASPGSAIQALSILCLIATASGASLTIRPGEIWRDDQGQPIQAHGGGIIRFRDTYYWFGRTAARDSTPPSAS